MIVHVLSRVCGSVNGNQETYSVSQSRKQNDRKFFCNASQILRKTRDGDRERSIRGIRLHLASGEQWGCEISEENSGVALVSSSAQEVYKLATKRICPKCTVDSWTTKASWLKRWKRLYVMKTCSTVSRCSACCLQILSRIHNLTAST
jgi:hypothetical protein